MKSDIETSGLLWWDENLAQQSVPFSTVLFPALLGKCDSRLLLSELSLDELRIIAQHCITSNSDQVTKTDFSRFLARFGPLELSLTKLVACFCKNRQLVPWFHGEIGRDEAERVLSKEKYNDGTFLVRFSESQPTNFTLTYMRIHSKNANTPGRREFKNCLVSNLGTAGYALEEAMKRENAVGQSRQRTFPSIGALIQSNSRRLKVGVTSDLSIKCNHKLATLTAKPDQHNRAVISDDYACFASHSVAPPTLDRIAVANDADDFGSNILPSKTLADDESPTSLASSNYRSFAMFLQGKAQLATTTQVNSSSHPSQCLLPTATVSDQYACLANLTSADSLGLQKTTSDQQAHANFNSRPLSIQPTTVNATADGSFASAVMSKPTPLSIKSIRDSSQTRRKQLANEKYGNFASFANELKEHWEQTLGPPPIVKKSSFDNKKISSNSEVYKDFASLSLSQPSSFKLTQTAPLQSLVSANQALPTPMANSDVYGSFNPTAATSASKLTPISSALDKLNIGMAHYKQKHLHEAFVHFVLAQDMARSTGDKVVEARALGNLGTVYLDNNKPHEAVRCYQQCLEITRAIGDTKRERTILNNLVLALVASEDFKCALACCQVQLETTTNDFNRRKIISRMSLLREKMRRQVAAQHSEI